MITYNQATINFHYIKFIKLQHELKEDKYHGRQNKKYI